MGGREEDGADDRSNGPVRTLERFASSSGTTNSSWRPAVLSVGVPKSKMQK